MLLRLDAVLFGRGFTEMKELPDLPPELSQIAVLIKGKVAIAVHMYIVTRYILCRYVRCNYQRHAE